MASPIIVTISHSLGAAEAQKRISQGIDKARSDFTAVISQVDLVWRANHADIAATALKQTVRAGVDVFDDVVRIEVQLPWYLSPLQEKIAQTLNQRGKQMLTIGRSQSL